MNYFNLGVAFLSPLVIISLGGCLPEDSKQIEERQKTCASLDEAIDRNIFGYAMSEAQSTSDKSAIQQGARATENQNRLVIIEINVNLMIQNKCQARKQPIDPTVYSSNANACYFAQLKALSAAYRSNEQDQKASVEKLNSDCDFKKWVPTSKSSK
ncbi:MAG: hypothetical protein FJY67_12160 [Calditrichaeota bacterium]|nr:hypothetical protein [Calditrichota bacterium]